MRPSCLRRHGVSGPLAALLLVLTLAGPAAAAGDDFADGLVDPALWGADEPAGNGTLVEANGRLELAVVVPTADDQVDRPWVAEEGPTNGSWAVQIDLANDTMPAEGDEVTSFGINVVSLRDPSDDFFAELYVSALVGGGLRRGFFARLRADGVPLPEVDTSEVAGTRGAVRIRFDAATKVLAADYDVDPANGHTWVPFASFGTAGTGGTDGNADFAMSDTDRFRIEIFGFAANLPVGSGEMWGDDFVTEGLVPAQPGLGLTNTDDDLRWSPDAVIPYRLTVTNTGAPRTGLVLHEIVPVATAFSPDDSTPGWTCSPGLEENAACTFPLGDLSTGESREVIFAARVQDGTRPEFDILNEAEVNPRAWDRTESDKLCEQNLPITPAIRCCFDALLEHFLGLSGAGTLGTGETSVDLLLHYRVRDRLFHPTPGGRRIIDLYYDHSPEMVVAAVADTSLVSLGRDAVLAWQPAMRALLDGTGDTTLVEAGTVQRFSAFLDALAPLVSPTLQAAIVRERGLRDIDDWAGRSAVAVLADVVEHASCDEAATLPSAQCRFTQLATLAERLVPAGKIARRLVAAARAGARHLDAAGRAVAQGKTRRVRAALRKALKTLGGVDRRLRSRAGQRAVPPNVRAMLAAEAGTLRTDVTALRGS